MVQRYVTYGFDWELEVYKCDAGNLVSYEDYAKLERKFNELRTWRVQVLNDAFSFLARAEKAEAELQKYKDQFPDYVECANCGSVTHVGGVE